MLAHRLRRWPNINPALGECLVYDADLDHTCFFVARIHHDHFIISWKTWKMDGSLYPGYLKILWSIIQVESLSFIIAHNETNHLSYPCNPEYTSVFNEEFCFVNLLFFRCYCTALLRLYLFYSATLSNKNLVLLFKICPVTCAIIVILNVSSYIYSIYNIIRHMIHYNFNLTQFSSFKVHWFHKLVYQCV